MSHDGTPRASHSFCTALLSSSRWFINTNTPTYIALVCTAVVAGYLSAQLSNDPTATGILRRHLSAFLFAGAVVAGILGAYFRSRADAASRAAADIEASMIAKDDRLQYDLCLEAASRWDGSRTDSSAVVSALASEQAKKTNLAAVDLADAVQQSAAAKEKGAEATSQATEAMEEVLKAVKVTIPPTKSPEVQEQIASATKAVQTAQKTAAIAKTSAEDASSAAKKAQEKLKQAAGDPTPVGSQTSKPTGH